MYKASEEYMTYIGSSLIRKPLSKIKINDTEYTELKEYPKFEHSTDKIFGAFPSKECSFEIYDLNGTLSLVGKEIKVYRGLTLPSGNEWIPMGVFKADSGDISVNTGAKTVKFKGYDRARRFDVGFDPEGQTYPCTVLQFVKKLCQNHEIELESDEFPMCELTLSEQPEISENTTERELIANIADLGGCIAQITRDGKLRISKPYQTEITVSGAKYKTLSYGKSLYVTSVILSESGGDDVIRSDVSLVGEYGTYSYKIEDNPFIKGRRSDVIDEIAENILGMNVTPFELTEAVDDFIFDLNDAFTVTAKSGESINATLLSASTQSRIKSSLKAEIASEETTSVQGSVKQQLKDEIKKTDSFKKAQDSLNELMTNAMGLYKTAVDSDTGGKIYYFHNEESLASSTYIVTVNSNGFAYTKGSGCWNGGDPVWQYGIDADGNAVLNTLSVHGIIADWIKAGIISSTDSTTYFDLDNAELVTTAEQTSSSDTTVKLTGKLNAGCASFSKTEVGSDGEETVLSESTVGDAGVFLQCRKPEAYVFKEPENWSEMSDIAKYIYKYTDMMKWLLSSAYGVNVMTMAADGSGYSSAHLDGYGLQFSESEYRCDGMKTDGDVEFVRSYADPNGNEKRSNESLSELSNIVYAILSYVESDLTPKDFSVTYASSEEASSAQFVCCGSRVDMYYRGQYKAHSKGDLLFTVPAAYAPSKSVYAPMTLATDENAANIAGVVKLATDGQLTVHHMNTADYKTRIYFQMTYFI